MTTKTCERCGKRLYRSYKIAVRQLLASARRSGLSLRIYECPVDKGYHLTKRPKNDPPQIRPAP